MKLIALALLVVCLPSCARLKAGWAEANKPTVSWGAYGPYDIYKSPLSSPYVAGYCSYPLTHCQP